MDSVVGTVEQWHDDLGWGVIASAWTPGNCWVHFSAVEVPGYRRLRVGQQVHLVAEHAEQDGCAHRAVRCWPVGQEPVPTPVETAPTAAYRSSLTLTFDTDVERPSP
ncbi:cold shock domain-containing protein [Modestobacter sp. I12A-02628]|uniref:Cold shock domain-containing protein n=1 Tax=Goekera deserti TaxID=2497753 RepID=A0A7K3WHN4_9ACTN|nr:cold shock domain-containing protein [Goekera deserti]MPQ99053.1 cold shock domain-containing protein [Goekera deserti]NDI47387.1 cold shock domain-containing protein [Goekera deserti]NEL55917.1 cold shock domain-containing protein [Goekera deserti]